MRRKAALVERQKFFPFIATMMYAFFEMNLTIFSKHHMQQSITCPDCVLNKLDFPNRFVKHML